MSKTKSKGAAVANLFADIRGIKRKKKKKKINNKSKHTTTTNNNSNNMNTSIKISNEMEPTLPPPQVLHDHTMNARKIGGAAAGLFADIRAIKTRKNKKKTKKRRQR